MSKDLSEKEFIEACKRNGISSRKAMGYHDVGFGYLVCAFNGGTRRRDQLAYLIKRRNAILAENETQVVDKTTT
jgi:hypothetical protein